jgi:hypothetical protein
VEILALFDANGRKVSGKMEGVHYKTPEERQLYIDEGFIPIAEDDLTLYSQGAGGANGTGYIRDPETGKPVDAPPYVPSKKEQADALFRDCQRDLQAIDGEILNAMADGDTEAVDELRQEKAERIEQYQHDLEELGV